MPTINYLIDEERITFFKNKQIQVAERRVNPWLYESLKEALPAGKDAIVFSPQQYLAQAFEERKNVFGIGERIKAIEAAGMPIEPYIAFISRLNSECIVGRPDSAQIAETIISKIGTIEAPLTWDGNLVLYQRSAWTNRNSHWAGTNKEFKPFNTIIGKLYAGEFTYTMQKCPDVGCAYEVVVQPEHIKNINDNGLWEVSQVMQLAELGREMTSMQQAEAPVVRYENKCVGDSNIAIRLPYNPATAASVAEFMMNATATLDLIDSPYVAQEGC